MVGVAQLVEPRVVIPVVVGSSPIVHPILGKNEVGIAGPRSGKVEPRVVIPVVVGSSPIVHPKFSLDLRSSENDY